MHNKIIAISDLDQQLSALKAGNNKLVFTNGCFDLLHPGHIAYLEAARQLGDILIVGINSDQSVQQLKGPSRPINTLEDRMLMLAALQSVDFVIPFDEETPAALIEQVSPQVLVKGGDYTIETIVGADHVKAKGGEVKIIPFEAGYSSSKLIDKIKNL